MTSLSQRLEVLGYPRVPALSSVSGAEAAAPHAEVVHCLCWLEDRHVRQLAIAARAPLRRASPADAWHAAFAEYLGAAGWRGAGSYAPACVPEALRWLAGHAIALEYEERAAEINAGAAAALAEDAAGAGAAAVAPAPAAPAPAADDAAIFALVRELAAKARLSAEEGRSTAGLATNLVQAVRKNRQKQGSIDAFMQEYSLSSEEGVVLMCLAEALLRIPDGATADKLIADKIKSVKFGMFTTSDDTRTLTSRPASSSSRRAPIPTRAIAWAA